MEIKFRKKLSDYSYLIMFDLAAKATGVCVWDLRVGKPIYTEALKVSGKKGNNAYELYMLLDVFFMHFLTKTGELDYSRVLVHRELCPIQQGRFTTAKTLIALGKAHAILDLYLAENHIDYYDLDGVSPSTTHAYFRAIMGYDPHAKVEKEDVRRYLVGEYGIPAETTLDETDAAFLAKTFSDVFWDRQIDEAIRERKRHKKTLKAPSAISAVDAEIERLRGLKLPKQEE